MLNNTNKTQITAALNDLMRREFFGLTLISHSYYELSFEQKKRITDAVRTFNDFGDDDDHSSGETIVDGKIIKFFFEFYLIDEFPKFISDVPHDPILTRRVLVISID